MSAILVMVNVYEIFYYIELTWKKFDYVFYRAYIFESTMCFCNGYIIFNDFDI